MTKKYILFPAIALALASCSQNDEPGTLSEPNAATFSAQIGQTVSRAAGTQWAAGDAIGISGVSGTKTYGNVKFVTASGDGNFATAGDNIFYQTTDPVTFTAYYPYADALGADGLISASTADQSQQPAFDFMWAQASGSYAAPAVNFTFAHRMARINIAFTNGNDVDLSDLTFSLDGLVADGTFDTATGEAKAADDGTAASLTAAVSAESKTSLIVFPQSADNLTVNVTVEGQQYSCTLSPGALAAGTAYTFNIAIKKTGMTVTSSTITDWTAGGSFDGNATMPVPARKGDFFYSDGTYSSSLNPDKTCIGIVFWTPAEANPDPNAETPASLTDDKIMNADFPNCNHGLVVALNDFNGQVAWMSNADYNIYNEFQSKDYFMSADKDRYRPIACGRGKTGELNYILGYQNTKILKAYKEWKDGSAPEISIFDALEEFSASNPAPKKTTGWYIPSAKELFLMVSADQDNVVRANTDEAHKDFINNQLRKANGTEIPRLLWSSTEVSTEGMYYQGMAYVLLSDYINYEYKSYNASLRPVLAF